MKLYCSWYFVKATTFLQVKNLPSLAIFVRDMCENKMQLKTCTELPQYCLNLTGGLFRCERLWSRLPILTTQFATNEHPHRWFGPLASDMLTLASSVSDQHWGYRCGYHIGYSECWHANILVSTSINVNLMFCYIAILMHCGCSAGSLQFVIKDGATVVLKDVGTNKCWLFQRDALQILLQNVLTVFVNRWAVNLRCLPSLTWFSGFDVQQLGRCI